MCNLAKDLNKALGGRLVFLEDAVKILIVSNSLKVIMIISNLRHKYANLPFFVAVRCMPFSLLILKLLDTHGALYYVA